MRLPEALRAFTGQPYVLLSELTDSASGLTRDEVAEHVLDGTLPLGDCELTPVSLAWPMGFGWSSFVAQSYMVDCCLEAGVELPQLITEEGHLPVSGRPAVSIATDDVLHYLQASPEEVALLDELPLSRLDSVWDARGLLRNEGTTFDLQQEATALGIRLSAGVQLTPAGKRVALLLLGAVDLLEGASASPRELSSFGGSLQWLNLLNRPLFSCLHA